ncbi:unnamed protein product [Choristocarpus tenellus]
MSPHLHFRPMVTQNRFPSLFGVWRVLYDYVKLDHLLCQVGWLRKRAGGHFEDEDPVALQYRAHAAEWLHQPVNVELRLHGGETYRLSNVKADLAFGRLPDLLPGRNGPVWFTDFDVEDVDDDSVEEASAAAGGTFVGGWKVSR